MSIPKEPKTRKEMYLAKISGETVEIPKEPRTREEMYLDAIAKNGAGGGSGDDTYTKAEIDGMIETVSGDVKQNSTEIAGIKEDYVPQTQLASNIYGEPYIDGIVSLGDAYRTGLTTNDSEADLKGKLVLRETTIAEVRDEQNSKIALHPNNIPQFMENYGITDKQWCHEIKKKTVEITFLTDGRCEVSGVVLYARIKSETDPSILVTPFGKRTGDNSILYAYNLTEKVAFSGQTTVEMYYIDPIPDEALSAADTPMEQPQLDEMETETDDINA